MNQFIKYICLGAFVVSFATVGYGYGDDHKDAKDVKCPEGQTFDKDVGACITAPAATKTVVPK